MSLAAMRSRDLETTLARAFSTRFSLSAANPTRTKSPRAVAEDVHGLGERDGQVVVGLLDLLVGGGEWTVVGHRRRHNQRVGLLGPGQHRVAHLLRRADRHHLHHWWGGQALGGGDQHHPRAPVAGSLGDGVAHLARGMVGDDAHRVNRLGGAACADDDSSALQVAVSSQSVSQYIPAVPASPAGGPSRSDPRPAVPCPARR